MPTNPFARGCVVSGCGQPATVRGRCSVHAGQLDQQRALTSDRTHTHLYASGRWQRLRRQILAARPFCECPDCGGAVFYPLASVVHHVRPHGGDETRFFDETNLQALAKSCHDRLTGRTRRK